MKYTTFLITLSISATIALFQSHPVAVATGALLLIVSLVSLAALVLYGIDRTVAPVYGQPPPGVLAPSRAAPCLTAQLAGDHRTKGSIHSTASLPARVWAALHATGPADNSGHVDTPTLSAPPDLASISQGIIIDTPWIDYILTGKKTWEMRSSQCKKRGPVALVQKGTKSIYGIAYICDSQGPLSDDELQRSISSHRIPEEIYSVAGFKWRHAWKLTGIYKLAEPIAYDHRGGVIWVNLDARALNRLRVAKLMPVTTAI